MSAVDAAEEEPELESLLAIAKPLSLAVPAVDDSLWELSPVPVFEHFIWSMSEINRTGD